MKPTSSLFVIAIAISLAACDNDQSSSNTSTTDSSNKANTSPSLKQEDVTYNGDNTTMKGYVVYDENKKGKRPAVLVVHEWWGMNDYPKMRARKLAELGYVAMAIDMYGNGKTVDNPTDAGNISGPFYSDFQMAKRRFDAALAKLKTYPDVDTNNIAAVGYCFGGGMVLGMAKLGDDLKAVVSFHGILAGPPADKNLLKAKMLVCHGEADKFVSQADVQQFRRSLDSIHADYEFKQYPDANHAFTNPAATDVGKKYNIAIAYNAAADSASWNDMKAFFMKVLK
jgi:dienelactone hydrolase